MESKELDKAYCAGLFDGEGCLSVSPYMMNGYRRFHCDIFVGMQNRPALEFLQQTVGTGSIGKRKDVWMFQATGPNAVHALTQLLPYLHVKQDAARLFCEFAALFVKRGMSKPTPSEIVAKRMALSEAIRAAMKRDARAFHTNGVNSVEPSREGGNTEPSALNGEVVGATVYRLEGAEPSNKPSTKTPPEREKVVGAA